MTRVSSEYRRPRDNQRSKVYKAEITQGKRLESVGEMQAYVDKLVKSAWFRRHYPETRLITVRPGKGHIHATAGGHFHGVLQMPKWSRVESALLHEVAHVCSPISEKHGSTFTYNYLQLIKHCLGKEAYDNQRLRFKEFRVRYTRS